MQQLTEIEGGKEGGRPPSDPDSDCKMTFEKHKSECQQRIFPTESQNSIFKPNAKALDTGTDKRDSKSQVFFFFFPIYSIG